MFYSRKSQNHFLPLGQMQQPWKLIASEPHTEYLKGDVINEKNSLHFPHPNWRDWHCMSFTIKLSGNC